MFEEAKKPPLLISDLRPMPLWAIFKSVFWTKSDFWVIAQPQAIACTQTFFHGMKVDRKDFQKTIVTYVQVMAKVDIQVQSLTNFSNFVVSGHDS